MPPTKKIVMPNRGPRKSVVMSLQEAGDVEFKRDTEEAVQIAARKSRVTQRSSKVAVGRGDTRAARVSEKGNGDYEPLEEDDFSDYEKDEAVADSDTDDDSEEDMDEAARLLLSNDWRFQIATGSIIFANTVMMGLECVFVGRAEYKQIFENLELMFTILYVMELVVRIRDLKPREFFLGSDSGWNWFDFSITALGVLDSFRSLCGQKGFGSSAARLFRVLRIMRLFRAFKFMAEVDVVVSTAGKATIKLAFLVSLVVFVSAVVTTNTLWDSPNPEVREQFHDLFASMWSTFKLMTLDNWIQVVDEATEDNPGMKPFFVGFIFVAAIALMSLVPAIFIELNMTEREKEEQMEVVRRRNAYAKTQKNMIKKLFRLADANKNGKVSVSEMKDLLESEDTLRTLQERGLTPDGMYYYVKLGLFNLWEECVEEFGEVDIEISLDQFVVGVLKGGVDVDEVDIWRGVAACRKHAIETRRQVEGLHTVLQEKDLALRRFLDNQFEGLREEIAAVQTAQDRFESSALAAKSSSGRATAEVGSLRRELEACRAATEAARSTAEAASQCAAAAQASAKATEAENILLRRKLGIALEGPVVEVNIDAVSETAGTASRRPSGASILVE